MPNNLQWEKQPIKTGKCIERGSSEKDVDDYNHQQSKQITPTSERAGNGMLSELLNPKPYLEAHRTSLPLITGIITLLKIGVTPTSPFRWIIRRVISPVISSY